MRYLLICLPLAAALAACSPQPPAAGDNETLGNTEMTVVDPAEGENGMDSMGNSAEVSSLLLDPYVGRYPHEEVDGVKFYHQPQVKAAVNAAVTDPAIREWIFGENGPQTPIVKIGDRYAAWGCEKSNCGDRNWTVLLTAEARSAQVCYKADGAAKPVWYENGKKLPRTDDCPSEG